ncbi:MAG: hypothetical protein KGM91_11300 [Burkholderiales bacterium]|nr:hypothetical protein [Burkholderiales bacterium]
MAGVDHAELVDIRLHIDAEHPERQAARTREVRAATGFQQRKIRRLFSAC